MNDGLKEDYRRAIRAVLAACPRVERAVLFGSRATGTCRPESDIDLCLFGDALSLEDMMRIAHKMDELTVPQRVDIVLFHRISNTNLKNHIEQFGVEWFKRSAAKDDASLEPA